ncbi:hypothetical protein [Parendozoicomonas haliclonae]|uniref:Uncharacterized protein n=1 Tax=Parendozoicomonas haliclonae TaxID=1960125 RepID=A0A1X7AHK4_9GAMM|nr:hypothetical protein [Parendozoicomonas haliclonae]SMA43026.1 hypothetical protein EHSB41UT_01542 [Parendozoicomonas haliclonae]
MTRLKNIALGLTTVLALTTQTTQASFNIEDADTHPQALELNSELHRLDPVRLINLGMKISTSEGRTAQLEINKVRAGLPGYFQCAKEKGDAGLLDYLFHQQFVDCSIYLNPDHHLDAARYMLSSALRNKMSVTDAQMLKISPSRYSQKYQSALAFLKPGYKTQLALDEGPVQLETTLTNLLEFGASTPYFFVELIFNDQNIRKETSIFHYLIRYQNGSLEVYSPNLPGVYKMTPATFHQQFIKELHDKWLGTPVHSLAISPVNS